MTLRQQLEKQQSQLAALIVRLEDRGHAQAKAGNMASARATHRTFYDRLLEWERIASALYQLPPDPPESTSQPALF